MNILLLAVIGIFGGILCAIADLFLDLKGADNKKLGKLRGWPKIIIDMGDGASILLLDDWYSSRIM